MSDTYLYVSRYGNDILQGGIDSFKLNKITGELLPISDSISLHNPSYLNVNKKDLTLYSTVKEKSNEESGKLLSFDVDKSTGKLKYISETLSKGRSPVYITVKKDNSYIATSNYRSGTLAIFPVKNKTLNEASSIRTTKGSGFLEERQDKPYPHFTTFSHNENYLLTVYLGLDSIKVHYFNKDNGETIEEEKLNIEVKKGRGPRHLVLSDDDKYLYILTELSSEILVYRTNDFKNPFILIQTISTLPKNFKGINNPAAIYISNDGNFLYVSNRGHDSIAVFEINLKDGTLKNIDYSHVYGKNPRDFTITEDGSFLIVANQTSGNITTFKIDKSTGILKYTGNCYNIENVVCVQALTL